MLLHFSETPDDTVVPSLLGCMAACYPERYTLLGSNTVIRAGASPDRVAIITSGGGGAEPQFAGYAAEGLADAACVGNLRAAPNAYALYETGKLLGHKHGVLFVYNNFAGDLLNNDMAAELLDLEGIASRSVLVSEDIASARGEPRDRRGGLCGILFVLKAAAEAARRGLPLDECRRIAEKTNARTGSISLVEDAAAGEIMLGSGFSGEPPVRRLHDRDARAAAETVCGMLVEDIRSRPGERLDILVNSFGASNYMESLLFARAVTDEFRGRGYAVGKVRTGRYFDPPGLRGYYLSVLSADEELRDYCGGTVHTESYSL